MDSKHPILYARIGLNRDLLSLDGAVHKVVRSLVYSRTDKPAALADTYDFRDLPRCELAEPELLTGKIRRNVSAKHPSLKWRRIGRWRLTICLADTIH